MGYASAAVARVASDGSSAEMVSPTSSRTKLPLCPSKGFQKSDPVSLVFQPGVTEGKVSWRKEGCAFHVKSALRLQTCCGEEDLLLLVIIEIQLCVTKCTDFFFNNTLYRVKQMKFQPFALSK